VHVIIVIPVVFQGEPGPSERGDPGDRGIDGPRGPPGEIIDAKGQRVVAIKGEKASF
jgi:hypothetical protein